MRYLSFTVVLVALSAPAGTTPPFTTTPMTFSGTPSAIALGPDGNVWMTDRPANKIGRLTANGTYTAFAIPTANAIASGITLGPDGNLWFAEFGPSPNKIGRATPDGVITEFSLAAGKSLGSLAAGDDDVWFTESQSSNGPPVYFLGRISAADGTITEIPLPTNGRAQGLVTGADGNLWVGWVESSGTKYDVLRVGTDRTVTTFGLPTGPLNALGATMLLGPDGNVWFTFQNNLARVKLDGTVTLYPIPTANSNMLPAGLAIGTDGNIWFTEFSSGKIGQLIVSSATDSGQATINESGTIGGLPQTMLLLPLSARASNKVGALDDVQPCAKERFVIEYQDASTGPPKLVITTAAVGTKCADVTVDIRFSLDEGPALKRWLFEVEVDNDGPDDAQNVQVNAHITTHGLAEISGVLPPLDELFLPAGDCKTTAHDVSCKWPVIPSGKKDYVVMNFVDDANLPPMEIVAFAWSSTPDPLPKNNISRKQFTIKSYNWGIQRGTALPTDKLITTATPSRH